MLCIPKKLSEKLLKAAKAGEFTVYDMTQMTSEQRRTMLTEYIGKENAKEVNDRDWETKHSNSLTGKVIYNGLSKVRS